MTGEVKLLLYFMSFLENNNKNFLEVNTMTICNTYLEKIFHSSSYLLHNEKRLIHLKSLNLLITGQVLEVGAGIGDFTPFFIEHGCIITATDGRV
jgi:hypothetical protein